MSKLRLDFALNIGCKLEPFDTVTIHDKQSDGSFSIVRAVVSDDVNGFIESLEDEINSGLVAIESFVMRRNTGVQSMPDNLPVMLFESGTTPGFKASIACNAEWRNIGWYSRWKPNMEKLIETQEKYFLRKNKSVIKKKSENEMKTFRPNDIQKKLSKVFNAVQADGAVIVNSRSRPEMVLVLASKYQYLQEELTSMKLDAEIKTRSVE